MKILFTLLLTILPALLFPQSAVTVDSLYTPAPEVKHNTRKFHFITNVPYDLKEIGRSPFQKKNLKGLLITAGATALLIPFDQEITDGVKHFFRQLNVDPDTDYNVAIKVGETKILKIPRNLTSVFYQLGEGGTSMMLAAGLFIYGKIDHNKRAIYTAGDITETFITMGISTQILKRISGRQSPFVATKPGGEWHPFPSFKKYQTNTSNYDAFPSGHLATMMATVTTVALNYPEKKWIKPLGYSLMSLTALAMLNTDVHWIGDYPLALALGYISARITHEKNHKKIINIKPPGF